MPSVEGLRVVPVEALEAGRELLHGRLDDEVVVVRHQAERVELPVMLPDDHAEEPEEEAAVVVVAIDRDAPGTARGDVEVAVGEDVARKSGHSEPPYAAQRERRNPCGRTVTLPTHAAAAVAATAGDCPQTRPPET
jgi:co-chaperonin GroES (HSP10)